MAQTRFSFRSGFIASVIVLPRHVLPKLVRCLQLLARDPGRPSLNLEGVRGGVDGLYSARVDRAYRLIFRKLAEDDLLLMAVAKHDGAYLTAKRMPLGVAPYIRLLPPQKPALKSAEPAAVIRLVSPKGRKYLPLSKHLAEQPRDKRHLELTFADIIIIIRDELPKSAYLHPAWWSNDGGHVQAAAWLTVGWKTTDLRLKEGRVAFVRKD